MRQQWQVLKEGVQIKVICVVNVAALILHMPATTIYQGVCQNKDKVALQSNNLTALFSAFEQKNQTCSLKC